MTELTVYAAGVVVILLIYSWSRRLVAARQRTRFERARGREDMEPASLHPVIDPATCMGCGACVKACPEGDVLGIVDGRARLVTAQNCIGHGACAKACPYDAIELVFGTERRGVDIPQVERNFETNVEGLFISGELGGMGLVANAVEQGCQAVEYIARRVNGTKGSSKDDLGLVIVGAGPSGIAASLMAKKLGLKFVTLEQDTLGGTVNHFPRHKVVMTRPVKLPLYGSLKVRRVEKEKLVEMWQGVIARTGIEPRFGSRVDRVAKQDGGFVVTTENQERYRSRCVLLAIGRRGTPRRLGVPGEESRKVFYRLLDPEQYADADLLVVGGGDSALESAMMLAGGSGNRVTLSYRGTSVYRAKPENRSRFQSFVDDGRIVVLWESTVTAITSRSVVLETPAGGREIDNDWVLVSAGGVLPTALLQQAGVEVRTWHGVSPGR